jgi:hypothetical protein
MQGQLVIAVSTPFFSFFFWVAQRLGSFFFLVIFNPGCGFGHFSKRIAFAFLFGPLLAIFWSSFGYLFSCSLP